MRSYWENNGKIYVNQKTFYSCMSKIGIWLNIPSLIPHLQDQGLATNTDDTDSIINPFFEPHMRSASVASLTCHNTKLYAQAQSCHKLQTSSSVTVLKMAYHFIVKNFFRRIESLWPLSGTHTYILLNCNVTVRFSNCLITL